MELANDRQVVLDLFYGIRQIEPVPPHEFSGLSVIGVDACPAGWVAVRLHLNTRRLEGILVDQIELLFSMPAVAVAAVDIPIGLPETGRRGCDVLARERLGSRRSSVFPAPIRSALNAPSREDASRITFARDGRRVTCQAFALYGKIAKVDRLLRASPMLRQRVFEIHPEISFWAWNGYQPLAHRKKSHDGKTERLRLIRDRYGDDGIAIMTALRDRHWCHEVADDDLHDAFAALWTAERIYTAQFRSLPEEPVVDFVGLPMRIAF